MGYCYVTCPTCCNHCIPCLMYFKVIIVLYENVLYVKFTGMYYFTEKVDFKILQN